MYTSALQFFSRKRSNRFEVLQARVSVILLFIILERQLGNISPDIILENTEHILDTSLKSIFTVKRTRPQSSQNIGSQKRFSATRVNTVNIYRFYSAANRFCNFTIRQAKNQDEEASLENLQWGVPSHNSANSLKSSRNRQSRHTRVKVKSLLAREDRVCSCALAVLGSK